MIWARVKSPAGQGAASQTATGKGAAGKSGSVFINVDGQEDIFDFSAGEPQNDWKMLRINGRDSKEPMTLNPRIFQLKAGKHTLTFRGREVGALVDWVTITNDLADKPEPILD